MNINISLTTEELEQIESDSDGNFELVTTILVDDKILRVKQSQHVVLTEIAETLLYTAHMIESGNTQRTN